MHVPNPQCSDLDGLWSVLSERGPDRAGERVRIDGHGRGLSEVGRSNWIAVLSLPKPDRIELSVGSQQAKHNRNTLYVEKNPFIDLTIARSAGSYRFVVPEVDPAVEQRRPAVPHRHRRPVRAEEVGREDALLRLAEHRVQPLRVSLFTFFRVTTSTKSNLLPPSPVACKMVFFN